MGNNYVTFDNLLTTNAAVIMGILILFTVFSGMNDREMYTSLIFHLKITVNQTIALTIIPFAVSSWFLIFMQFFKRRIENNLRLENLFKRCTLLSTGFGFGYMIFWVILFVIQTNS